MTRAADAESAARVILSNMEEIQKLRLIVNGAVCLYEGQGLEIPAVLEAQIRDDLLIVLDA